MGPDLARGPGVPNLQSGLFQQLELLPLWPLRSATMNITWMLLHSLKPCIKNDETLQEYIYGMIKTLFKKRPKIFSTEANLPFLGLTESKQRVLLTDLDHFSVKFYKMNYRYCDRWI